ncbi:BLUF domain-containing protein [Pseudoalteromonas ardens]|uniref:BLUF domain-containing protein n=1 Tax=Pseudoalteromonas ardens TaxID=3048490 RepID=UPI0006765F43|nr:BLUF domain-containing protein [Pseudoalteromonas sp. R96]MDK1312086.1 BLUF domain-containing protein [Pseudoalteromonas sp. R96]
MALIELIYVSTVTTPLSDEQLIELNRFCKSTNQLNGISGMLLYDGHHFMQVIEGERDHVERLYKNIQQDPRHTEVVALIINDLPKRNFSRWSMGVIDLSKHPSYRKVKTTRPHRRLPLSYKLLKSFRDHEMEFEERVRKSFG